MVSAAADDVRVALGLLDVRHLAGDPNLTLRLRTTMLTSWRRGATEQLPALRKLVRARHELVGELAHVSVPDLKEAQGGLRDANVLTALVATWLVDVPHADLDRSRRALLDVRDVLHEVVGRPTDRIAPEVWPELAEPLGLEDAVAVQRHVRELGRRITHLSRLTWRRVDGYLTRPSRVSAARRPDLLPVAPGVAVAGGEVVLDVGARPDADPLLLLRAAAEAAERDLVLAPPTAARLAREGAALPEPWSPEARRLLVRMLAAGPGLLPVWETLEETGALDRLLPEWERIRLLPHASPIHRFTVDRHVVETCIEASALIRAVSRPDVLMVAALLHDIGKGGLTEHSVAGEPIARRIATRMGFDDEAVELIGALVRWHLLLVETATTRDPDDPATVERVTERIGSAEGLALLMALTEADAKAASSQAWSSWRSGLVRQVGAAALAALDTGAVGPDATARGGGDPEGRAPRGREHRGRADRGRRPGHRDRPGPRRAARRRCRHAGAPADLRPRRPGLGAGGVRPGRLGRRGRLPGPHRAPAALRRDRQRPDGRPVPPGAALDWVTSRPRSPSAPRRRAEPRSSRCGRPTGPGCCSWCCPRWPTSTSPSGPRT